MWVVAPSKNSNSTAGYRIRSQSIYSLPFPMLPSSCRGPQLTVGFASFRPFSVHLYVDLKHTGSLKKRKESSYPSILFCDLFFSLNKLFKKSFLWAHVAPPLLSQWLQCSTVGVTTLSDGHEPESKWPRTSEHPHTRAWLGPSVWAFGRILSQKWKSTGFAHLTTYL